MTHLLHRLYGEAWLILPHAHAAMVAAVNAGAHGVEGTARDDVAVTADGVAVVYISGVMDRGVGPMGKLFGFYDTAALAPTMAELAADPAVRAVVLSIDSPGGSVSGVPGAADAVLRLGAQKPVIAHTAGTMASAAYWVASGANAIYADKGASVGSIGVYMPFLDMSRMYSNAGVEVDIIKPDGLDFKGAGFPGTALTAEQREQLVEQTRELYDEFAGFVSSRRGIAPEHMRGQAYYTSSALRAQMVDSVATLEDAVADAARLAGLRTN